MVDFIQRLQQHEEKALRYVVQQYLGYVKAIAHKILGDSFGHMLVEECANDVFLLIWQKCHQFEGDETDFKKWLGIIAKYKAIELYRKHQKYQDTVSIEQAPPQISQDNIEIHLEKSFEKEILLIEVLHLPPSERELFLMKYYLDYTNGEIADILHISKAAVENRLYRGKKKLAKNPKLKECLS
ncbi:sigma-70 family RNA polymerase sigma factor [Lysinibacillus sp. LZ02]|uniref:sigma-70 family RNA polymerase sigma factor n=1 Tax=Lysinibacillus sp. LZ02 TaxID=3420668 RepID=UPI003D35CB40